MRRSLIILMAAILLAPDPFGLPASSPVQSCACEPAACHCSGHDHSGAHGAKCVFANGGRCGVKSADLALGAMAGRFQLLVSETPSLTIFFPAKYEIIHPPAQSLSWLGQPPKPPPRLAA